MNRPIASMRLRIAVSAVLLLPAAAEAAKISGTISSTTVITEDSDLVGDVTCTVTGAPCIAVGASHVTLNLNGFTMTGQADPEKPCNGGPVTGEVGILVKTQTAAAIQGPGLVRQFRASGVNLVMTTGVKVTGVTTSTNCMSGILVNAGSGNELERNISIRNGVPTGGCGGI